jgi:hypothetical protein
MSERQIPWWKRRPIDQVVYQQARFSVVYLVPWLILVFLLLAAALACLLCSSRT